jgi:hypothetical protein
MMNEGSNEKMQTAVEIVSYEDVPIGAVSEIIECRAALNG